MGDKAKHVQVKLQSGGEAGEQQVFTVDKEIAEMSGTIKNILEGKRKIAKNPSNLIRLVNFLLSFSQSFSHSFS
jgi:hypothetical protein